MSADTRARTAPSVAQVVSFYPPRLGGVENVARSLATVLARHRRVEVVTTDCGTVGAPAVERTRPGDGAGELTVRRHRGWAPAHTPVSPGFVLGLLRLPRTCLVHAHLAQAFLPEAVWLTSRLRRRPYLVHFHLDVDPSGPLGFLLAGYKRAVLGPVLRGAAAVIALSERQRDFLTETYRVPPTRIHVMPNGVDEEFLVGAPTVRRRGEADPIRLLFVGRLEAQKNAGRFLEAVAAMQAPAEVVVVGDGEQAPDLRTRAERLGLDQLRFVGAQRGAALREFYDWADVLVSSSDREGVPLVLLEAMAAGLPIVATDVDGTRELLTGIGLLTPPDPVGLAAGLDRAATDADLLSRLARRSHRRGQDTSWSARIDQLEQIYATVGRSDRGASSTPDRENPVREEVPI